MKEKESYTLLADMDRTITSLKAGLNALDGICEGMANGTTDPGVFVNGLAWTLDMVRGLTEDLANTVPALERASENPRQG